MQKVKGTFLKPEDYPDCTSFVVPALTLDETQLPRVVTAGNGELTVKLSKNTKLNPPAFVIKIWDAAEQEPSDPTDKRVDSAIEKAKKAGKRPAKKAAVKKPAAKKKGASKKSYK